MDKVACCLQNMPPCGRSVSFFRRILPKPKRTTGNIVMAAVSTPGRNTNLRGGFSLDLDFQHYMCANATAVDKALDRALPAVGRPERLSECMRYSVLPGGKRVFPVLVIAACELVGGSAEVATPVACAVEMVHCMTIMHDDMPCMDNEALRRGLPATHAVFGEYTTMLAGDTLFALAFDHLARGCAELGGGVVPAERALRAAAELAAGAVAVSAGQFADKASEGGPVSLAMLEYIYLHKTAGLLEAAAVCGAIVGGGTDTQIESVRQYARSVGLLFQLVDDVLDSEIDEAVGKDTYQKLVGVDKAQAYAAELLVKAEGELQGFDVHRAAPLHHLARFVAYRHI